MALLSSLEDSKWCVQLAAMLRWYLSLCFRIWHVSEEDILSEVEVVIVWLAFCCRDWFTPRKGMALVSTLPCRPARRCLLLVYQVELHVWVVSFHLLTCKKIQLGCWHNSFPGESRGEGKRTRNIHFQQLRSTWVGTNSPNLNTTSCDRRFTGRWKSRCQRRHTTSPEQEKG